MSHHSITSNQLSAEYRQPRLTGEWVTNQYRFLLGRVLTIVDSAVADTRQNKAMKDLIKGEFMESLTHISDIVLDGRDVVAPDNFDPDNPDNHISEDEVLGIK